jgi:hypothetical protein
MSVCGSLLLPPGPDLRIPRSTGAARRAPSLEEQTGMRDRLPLHKRVTWLYAVLLAGIGGAIIWADEHWPHLGWLQRHGPNFGADFIGLAITLLLVDRILVWRRDAELHPRRRSAVRRLGEAVRDLEIQMAWVYKAASTPSNEPRTVETLIDEFVGALERLDFGAAAVTEPPTRWRSSRSGSHRSPATSTGR